MSDPNPYAAPAPSPPPPPSQSRRADLHQRKASRGQRFVGHLIDTVLIIIGALLPIVAIAFFVPGAAHYLDEQLTNVSAAGSSELLLTVGWWACTSLVVVVLFGHWIVTRGQTPGKMVMGIRIVRSDGSPVGWWHGVVLRYVVRFGLGLIPVAGRLLGLINAVLIFENERRCLHDHIADTIVILDG
ncbi:MAG: RDD family protein [Acidobacteriota bacterium]